MEWDMVKRLKTHFLGGKRERCLPARKKWEGSSNWVSETQVCHLAVPKMAQWEGQVDRHFFISVGFHSFHRGAPQAPSCQSGDCSSLPQVHCALHGLMTCCCGSLIILSLFSSCWFWLQRWKSTKRPFVPLIFLCKQSQGAKKDAQWLQKYHYYFINKNNTVLH